MKTMILWLMVTPGNWEVYTDVYASAAECHRAEHVLIALSPHYRWDHFKTIYRDGGGLGMMFIACH